MAFLGVAGVVLSGCAGPEEASPDGAVADRADSGTGAADAPAAPADGAAPDVAATADGSPVATGAGCQTDNDCLLISDCCSCQAIPRGEKAPSCDPKRSCVMSVCAQYQGVDQARCSAGRCVLGFECDPTKVLCKRLPPVCPPGQVPRVLSGCYGECVDARQCLTVPSCAVCGPADTCVGAVAALPGLHCHALSTPREM